MNSGDPNNPTGNSDPVGRFSRLVAKLAAHPEDWEMCEDVLDKVHMGRANRLTGTVSVDLHTGNVKGPATLKGS